MKADPLRGFTDDGEDVAEANRPTVQQKVNFLEFLLGQKANYCPIIARNMLVKNSTPIQPIWNTIRQRFGYQITLTLLTFICNPMKGLKICSSS